MLLLMPQEQAESRRIFGDRRITGPGSRRVCRAEDVLTWNRCCRVYDCHLAAQKLLTFLRFDTMSARAMSSLLATHVFAQGDRRHIFEGSA